MQIGRTTVASILAEAGIEPVPERSRKRTWKHLLRIHCETLDACDFFAVETLVTFGTVRFMVMFVNELRSRAVHFAAIRIEPDSPWVMQVTRNSLDPSDGLLRHATHLIADRDPLFTKAWASLLESGGVKSVRIPASSPNCNPHAQRFLKTVRAECLEHLVIFGERHLRVQLRQFVDPYHTERHHQGIGGRLVRPAVAASNDNSAAGVIHRRSRLRGLLSYYHREAA